MTERSKAAMAIKCRKRSCGLTSAITEHVKAGCSVEYRGRVSCDSCGRKWSYKRSEGQAAVLDKAA